MPPTCPDCARHNSDRASRCLYCGASLDAPDTALEEVRAGAGSGPWVFCCSGCDRQLRIGRAEGLLELLRRGRTRCLFCGAPLELPEEVAALAGHLGPAPVRSKPFVVPCPGCGRTTRADPARDPKVRCRYCALRFVTPAGPGEAIRLGPLDGAGPLPDGQLEQAFELLPGGAGGLAGRVLAARRDLGELADGEAPWLADRLAMACDEVDEGILPIDLEDAEAVVPRLVFGSGDCGVLPSVRGRVLLITLSADDPDGPFAAGLKAATAETALNVAAGALGSVAGPLARSMVRSRRSELEGTTRYQARVELTQTGQGVGLHASHQVDNERPTPLSPDRLREIAGRIRRARRLLPAYLLRSTLFGTSCRGSTAFSIQPEAIEARLVALGLPADEASLSVLRLSMPPLFQV